VGKSTLFNRLAGKRVAIVEDVPGVTRDRNYAEVNLDDCRTTLVDTGGLEPETGDELIGFMAEQVAYAVDEADLVLFVTDGHEGIMPVDYDIADFLRRRAKQVLLVVNKVDGPNWESNATEFYGLGFENLLTVSAEHKRGTSELIDQIVARIEHIEPEEEDEGLIKLAVLGRPNTGKSSLVNKILGAERVVVSSVAGTTRDAIDTRLQVDDDSYMIIDTAGIRRKPKVEVGVERYSVVKAFRSINRAHVCILMVDSQEGVTDQDLRILDMILTAGRAAMICFNKWDLVEKDGKTFDERSKELTFRLGPHRHVPVLSISALTGLRTHKIFDMVKELFVEWNRRITTSQLNNFIEAAMSQNAPAIVGRKRTRIYYATQVTSRPPSFALFSSYPEGITVAYQRYLTNRLRDTFGFAGIPVRIFLRKRKRSGDEQDS
jgi:GTP-binding protein